MLNFLNYSYCVRKLLFRNAFQSILRISNYHKYNLALHHTDLHKLQVLKGFHKTTHFPQWNRIQCASFQFHKNFHCSSMKNQINSEIGLILSLSENKLKQLGLFNVDGILDVISKLEESTYLVEESDILKISNIIIEALQRDNIEICNVIEKYGKLLLSLKDLKSVEELLCNFLHMCFRSKSSFPYEEILSFMENNDYLWSQKVCELMVSNLCLRDMSESVANVFQKIKSLNMSLTYNIYSPLIRLYGKKRDLERIHDIINSMQNQIQSVSSFKSASIIAHNACEEYEKARTILEEFVNSDKKFESNQYCDILLSAIESGCYEKNPDYLFYIINSRNSLTENTNFKSLIGHLLKSNYLIEAVFLLSEEEGNKPYKSEYEKPSADFVRELINIGGNDNSAVVKFCSELLRNKTNEYAFEVALEHSIKIKNYDLSYELMNCLKSKRPLTEHLFWPLLFSADEGSKLENTLETVSKMVKLELDIGLETLMTYILPNIPLDTPKLSLEMLAKSGLSKSKIITPLLATLINNGKYEEVYEFLKDNCIPYILNNLTYVPLAKLYIDNRKVATELLLTLYGNGLQKEIASKDSVISHFASCVRRASKNKIRQDDVIHHFKSIENEDFLLPSYKGEFSEASNLGSTFQEPGNSVVNSLKGVSYENDYDSDFSGDDKNVYKSSASSRNIMVPPRRHYDSTLRRKNISSASHDSDERVNVTESMSVEELEGHLIELKTKGMNTRGVLRRLLLKHSASRNQKRIREISKELLELNSTSSPGMLSTLFYNKVLDGDAEAALKELDEIYNKYPDFQVDSFKIVDLCSLCVRAGKIQESLEVMRRHVKRIHKTFRNKKSILHNCHQLLTDCSTEGGYTLAREMCSTLLTGGLVDPSAIIFGPLINTKLQENDLAGAVEEAEEIFATHKILPLRVQLIVKILESEDESLNLESLVGRVVTLISKSRGPHQAKQDLLTAALFAQNEELASKVIENVGDDFFTTSIRRLCDYFVKLEKIDSLNLLLKISRASSTIDRSYICDSLLNIYFVNRNSKDALNLSMLMQDELLTPSHSFSKKLETLLKATGSSSALGTIL